MCPTVTEKMESEQVCQMVRIVVESRRVCQTEVPMGVESVQGDVVQEVEDQGVSGQGKEAPMDVESEGGVRRVIRSVLALERGITVGIDGRVRIPVM